MALGAQMGSSALSRLKYCHNGGMVFADHRSRHRLCGRGSMISIVAPAGAPQKGVEA
jgi:hypothetical protein